MADQEVREIRIRLNDAEQRVYSAACNLGLSSIPLAMSGGLLGGLPMSLGGAGVLGCLLATSFVNFLYRLKQLVERSAVRNRLLDQLDQNLGGNAEEFARRNPMAEVREEPEGFISITNPDGSPLAGIRVGSAAERVTRRMEDERAGVAREESAAREEEGLAEPAPSNRSQGRSRFGAIAGLPAPPSRYPQMTAEYLAAVRAAGASGGGAGYPRVGAVEDERKEDEEEDEEEEEDGSGGGFGGLHRNNPFYRGIRGLPRR